MHLSLSHSLPLQRKPETRIRRDPCIKYYTLHTTTHPALLLFFPDRMGSLFALPWLFGICAELETFRRGLAKNFVRARKNFLQNF